MRHVLIFLLMGLSWSATAQELRVVGKAPNVGTSSVPLETTLHFTFSTPLDTTMRFGPNGPVDFFAISPPDSVQIERLYFSEDLTQLFIDVVHTEETDFTWVLTRAQNQQEEVLCVPSILHYTTAASFGTWAVSGTVNVVILTSNKTTCGVTIPLLVALYDAPIENGGTLQTATVTDAFTYRLDHLREGLYWPYAFSDHRHQGSYGTTEHESAFYDPQGVGQPQPLVVADADLALIDLRILDTSTASEEGPAELPGVAALLPNYPNPFNPQTTVSFRLDRPGLIELSAYNVLGQRIATLVEGFFVAGVHEVSWKTPTLPSGPYLLRLAGDTFTLSRQVMVLK